MISVKKEFFNRVQEIELYFSFMENVILKEACLTYPDGSKDILNSDIKEIFKANSFLLLYNLSESSIKNAIEQIYLTIEYNEINYDHLKAGIKKEIINFLKNNINSKDFVINVNKIAFDIIIKCFDSEKLLSGNLDARKVKSLSTKYGFSSKIIPLSNSDGSLTNIDSDSLLMIKTRRNDLAHGIYSFKECGKDYTIQDLMKVKTHVIEYLRQIIDNIDTYIMNEEYLFNKTT